MLREQFDELIKHLLQRFAKEFVRLGCDTDDFEVLDQLDTELQTIKVHRTDMAFKVRLNGEEVLLHIEAQTEDSRDKPNIRGDNARITFLSTLSRKHRKTNF